jgi:hypothetical protein
MVDFTFGLFALGEINKSTDVICNLAGLVDDSGDVQPFGINLAVLAPVPDFSLPTIS